MTTVLVFTQGGFHVSPSPPLCFEPTLIFLKPFAQASLASQYIRCLPMLHCTSVLYSGCTWHYRFCEQGCRVHCMLEAGGVSGEGSMRTKIYYIFCQWVLDLCRGLFFFQGLGWVPPHPLAAAEEVFANTGLFQQARGSFHR